MLHLYYKYIRAKALRCWCKNTTFVRKRFYRELKQIANKRNIDIIVSALLVAIPVFTLLGARAVPIYVALLAVYLLPAWWYRQSRYDTTIGRVAIDIAFVSMAVFFALNYHQATVLYGTVDAPFLLHDAQSFYLLSHDIYNNTIDTGSPIVPYMGYPVFLSWWLHLGITDIAYPMIFNIFLMLVSILLLCRCTYYVLGKTSGTRSISGYAMCIMAIIPGVLSNAMILSKEPFIIFALILSVCALYAIKERHHIATHIALLIVGLAILSSFRATYIYILLIFMVAIWLQHFSRRDIIPALALLALAVVALYLGLINSWWQSSDFVSDYVEKDSNTTFFCGDSQEPLQQLIGPYNSYSLGHRLLLLPFCTVVQFFIPFPFETAASEMGLPLSMTIYQRMSYLWYAAAIPMLAFYLFYWWRKSSPSSLSIWAAVSAIAYVIPAFISAGAISRYAYCFVPFLSIIGAYTIHYIKVNRGERRKLYIFAITYALLVAIVLFIGANPHYLIK